MKHMAYIPGEKIWVKHECFFLWNHRQDVFTIEIVRWIFSNLKSEVDLRKRPVLVEAAEKNRILYTRMLKGQNISGWFNLKSFPPKECKTFDKKNTQKKQKTETPLNVFENTTSIGGERLIFPHRSDPTNSDCASCDLQSPVAQLFQPHPWMTLQGIRVSPKLLAARTWNTWPVGITIPFEVGGRHLGDQAPVFLGVRMIWLVLFGTWPRYSQTFLASFCHKKSSWESGEVAHDAL